MASNPQLSRAELVLTFAESLCKEAKFYAASNWDTPEPWRVEPATHKQIRQIQSRRCGPNYRERLPEPLYKAILYYVVDDFTSGKVRTKGQAADVLNTFAYCDEDILRQWESFVERQVLPSPKYVGNQIHQHAV